MSAPSVSVSTTTVPARWRWRVLAVVLLAEIVDLLDSTVMNVAAPAVRDGLGGGEAVLQWLAAGYTLAFGVLLVIGGRLGDRWGRRRLFVIGAVGFTVASTVCALAPSVAVLIVARVAQGAFGALMIPQGFGVLTTVFDEHERGKAFGMFGPVMGLAAVGGPILAGGLIAWDAGGLGWRLIFLITVPLGVAAVLGALAWMPADRGDDAVRLDPVGAVLVALGSALLIHPLIQGREAGWPWWTVAEIVAGVVAFVALARRQRTSPSPILVPSLLRRPTFVSGLVTALAFFAGIGGLLLIVSLFLQVTRGGTPLQAALVLTPVAVGIAVASIAGPKIAARLGRRVLHLGLVLEALGCLGLAAVGATDAPDAPLAAATLLIGLGMGVMIGPLFQTVLATVTVEEVGSASGVLNAIQQLATALGVAVLGTVFFALDARPAGLVAGALIVAAGAGVCAALVLLLPRTLSPSGDPA